MHTLRRALILALSLSFGIADAHAKGSHLYHGTHTRTKAIRF